MHRMRNELGTPLGSNAVKLLLLGGGELGKEIALEAQRLGIEVIVADRYDWAPAMHIAHRKYVIDLLDYSAVKAVVEREKPDVIVPEIEAINVDVLEELEAKGYHIVPNAKAVRVAMNKLELRKFAAKLGLPTTRYRFASSWREVYEACEEIGPPCLVKPEMSSSGHGHYKMVSADIGEAKKAYEHAIAYSRGTSRRVIVEEHVELETELTVIVYRWVDADRGSIATNVMEPIEHWRYGKYHYIESWQPSTRSRDLLTRAENMALKIAEALGGLGVFGVEFLYTRDGRLLFNEVAPRPHDTGLVTIVSQDISEFEAHVRAILGLPIPEIKLLTPAASVAIYTDLDGKWHPVLRGVYEAIKIPGVKLLFFGKPFTYRGRRMAVVIARGETVEEARRRAREAAKRVRVVPRD
ncbi:MAG TPA: formate-dependent phosphoribosylglycinamide formyltransferase [Pyrodictium sp.]|nr:formate-dependent phosphoribosylglycinamide formyltransferase [Pyrodictium sp.]